MEKALLSNLDICKSLYQIDDYFNEKRQEKVRQDKL